jgi:hypothetical protein
LLPIETKEQGRGSEHPVSFVGNPATPLGVVVGALANRWLHWCADDVVPQPWAEVHARFGVPGGAPAIVESRVGRGRVIFVATDETWRWEAAGRGEAYARVWTELLRLGMNWGGARVRLRADRQHDYQVGETCTLEVDLPPGRHQATTTLLVRQRAPGHVDFDEPRALPCHETSANRRRMEARLGPLAAGDYLITWPGTAHEVPVELHIHVRDGLPEEEGERCYLDALRLAANLGGNQVLARDDVDSLIEAMNAAPTANTTLREVSLWDHPLAWALVLFLLNGDWLARRWFP